MCIVYVRMYDISNVNVITRANKFRKHNIGERERKPEREREMSVCDVCM